MAALTERFCVGKPCSRRIKSWPILDLANGFERVRTIESMQDAFGIIRFLTYDRTWSRGHILRDGHRDRLNGADKAEQNE